MKKVSLILTAICFSATASFAASTKLQTSDIAEIVKTDDANQAIIVKTHDGRKYRLKVSDKQKKSIENAINNKKMSISKTVTKTKKKVEESKTVITKPAAASTTTVALPTSSQTAASTIAKAEDLAKDENKSPWSFSHLIWTSSNVNKLHNGEGATNLYNRFTIQYKLQNGIALKLRPTFTIDWDHQTSAATHKLADWVLEASKGGIELPAGLKLSTAFRYYLPTSQGTIDAERKGMMHLNFRLSKQFNPVFGVTYTATPRYYLNSQASNATFDEFDRVTNNPSGNQIFRFMHGFEFSQKVNDVVTFEQSIGLDHHFNLEDEGVGATGENVTDYEWSLGVGLSFVDWMSLTLAIDQAHPSNSDEGYSLFNTEQLTYNVVTNFTF